MGTIFPSFVDVVIPKFREAAGRAAELELRLRLLADLIVVDGSLGGEKELASILAVIVVHVGAGLSEQERELLTGAVQLRNKILHADFKAAVARVEGLRPGALEKDQVTRLDLSTGHYQRVAESSKREGRVYGWLMESHQNGTFDQACNVFREANALATRLAAKQAGAI